MPWWSGVLLRRDAVGRVLANGFVSVPWWSGVLLRQFTRTLAADTLVVSMPWWSGVLLRRGSQNRAGALRAPFPCPGGRAFCCDIGVVQRGCPNPR